MPVPEVPRLRLYVLWLPRAPSVRLYVDPDRVVVRSTVPEYTVLPVPVSIASHSYSFSPVVASVTTCSSCGVPSCWKPPTTVSYATVGLPSAAQITLRGALLTSGFLAFSALAAASACRSALAAGTVALVVAGLMAARVALTTPAASPDFVVFTTRSPPRTGSPSYVRS